MKHFDKNYKGDIGGDPVKGLKLCPLAVTDKAPNAALGKMLKHEIEVTNKEIMNELGYHKEIAERFRKKRMKGTTYTKQELDKVVTFSIDVVALYPSILKGMAMDSVKRAIVRTDIKW